MTTVKYALGVDVGGTKVATVIIDRELNVVHRVEVESITTNREVMFNQVTDSIDRALKQANISLNEIAGIGVGVPGKVDKTNGIAIYQNNLPWKDFPIVSRLREYYSFENIRIDNDVHVATLAEWKISELDKEATFVYFTVSTGVSCATIHRGEFIRGSGFAGEIGLFPVESAFFEGERVRLECAASGPTIEKIAKEKYNDPSIVPKQVFQKYREGCETATSIVQSVTKSLANGAYAIICLLDPQRIVFGGGVINNNTYLIDLIRDHLAELVIKEQKEALNRLSVSHFKEDSGAIGAGILGFI